MQFRYFILMTFCLAAFIRSTAQQVSKSTAYTAPIQKTLSAMDAYDRAQQARSDANDLWEKKGATGLEIEKGITILKKAVIFLDSIPVNELANGNIYLKARRNDIYLDMAQAYALANQRDSALTSLENMFALGEPSGVLNYIQKNPSLASIRTESRYLAVINKMKMQGELWENTALNTSYKNDLTLTEKIAGLSLLWSQAKYNFVYFDHLSNDWNQTYLDYIPKVQTTKSTAEYYRVLMNFYAQLKDGHTNVYPPDSLSTQFYSRPPMRTELIEGRVFITEVSSDSLYKAGVQPGLEIVKIDNEPVIDYSDRVVKPYQSSSTPQDLEVRQFTYGLLSGPKEKPIVFQLKDKMGKITERTAARTGYHDIKSKKSLEYQTIGNVGYLTINDFENNRINKNFDSLYTQIAATRGLIIDIRYNGGGSGNIGFNIISKLTNKSFKTSASKTLQHTSRPGDEPRWEISKPYDWAANGKIYYDKPVIVLIGPRTFSAAEDFAVAFDYMKRGKLIGTATGGSTGQPVPFNLPGGGSARVCGKRDTYPDGKEFVGVGIMPDIVVKKTIKDLQSGKDAAKEKALEILNKGK
ncbi:S41 family peptidase [Mucilaginibacter glaciei]|uniref:Tail specific protease domain-containing protein n=1 Tax=Mucilaginibacter glaciei TaxID=2772109 RepID=A0A926NWP9_9SPHI|nr:S41 family peptidase [Mucilaginibacter glaciei]MBD1395475.1 hypothetical protein [Mucilaginibacter glaciei]